MFQRVLDLQHAYNPRPTPAMDERGNLIRNEIPLEMREWPAAQVGAARPFRGRLNVQGRDGTGLKTFVPWVRIHSPELSPSAQNGWYVVYLFRADGAGLYLCLSHGSTFFDGFTFVPRPLQEMEPLMEWARNLLGQEATEAGFEEDLDLAVTSGVALAYHDTTAFTKFYASGAIPEDDALAADAMAAVGLLGRIYAATEEGMVPGMAVGEVAEVEWAIEAIARPNSKRAKGQGFGLTHAQRQAVDDHAMGEAYDWLRRNGFTEIVDTSKTSAFDFTALNGDEQHLVEVKGTTGPLGGVILTKNEVIAHLEAHPANLLIVVHGIGLDKTDNSTSGGTCHVLYPWPLTEDDLTPLTFRYEVPQ